ncbi:MAG: ribose-5-phosphate isomerase RpiA [Pseudomonadota bacterium]
MTSDLSPSERAKDAAAYRAAQLVFDGMRVGLGTGSTAAHLVQRLGERVREEGLKFTAVATSERTAVQAASEGIEVVSLNEAGWLDLTIDGADEFDKDFNLIKGAGGALLREKIVATASDQMVVIADASKKVDTLGAFPLPVEVVPFGWQATKALIKETLLGIDILGSDVALRQNGDAAFFTDEGNQILDLSLRRIGKARQLALILNQIPGVVENGLFIDICDKVIIGFGDGRTETIDIRTGAQSSDGPLKSNPPDNLFTDIAD